MLRLDMWAEEAMRRLLFTIDPYGDALDEEREDISRAFKDAMEMAYSRGYAEALGIRSEDNADIQD